MLADGGTGKGVTCYSFWGLQDAATHFFSALMHSFKDPAARTRSLLQDMRSSVGLCDMVLQHMQCMVSQHRHHNGETRILAQVLQHRQDTGRFCGADVVLITTYRSQSGSRVLHLDPNNRTGAVLVDERLREALCILKYPREDALVRHVCHIGDTVSVDVAFEPGFGDSDAIH